MGMYANIVILLPPANEVWEGYVFTCVCLSTGGGEMSVSGSVSAPVRVVSAPEEVSRPTPGRVSRPIPRGVCVYPSMH